MDYRFIYAFFEKAFFNVKLAYCVYASLALVAIAIVAQMTRYAVAYRNAKILRRTKKFVAKNGCICQNNGCKYLKKIRSLMSCKEKDMLRSCIFDSGYVGSFSRERINKMTMSQPRVGNLFRNVALLYVFVLHAALVCCGLPWLAIYLIVFACGIALFVITKILAIIRRIWAYFDGKKAYKIDEVLCLGVGNNCVQNKVGVLEKLPQNYNFGKCKNVKGSLEKLCDGVEEFVNGRPNPQLAQIVGQNLAEIKNCGYLNAEEQLKFEKIEDSLNNYCS